MTSDLGELKLKYDHELGLNEYEYLFEGSGRENSGCECS